MKQSRLELFSSFFRTQYFFSSVVTTGRSSYHYLVRDENQKSKIKNLKRKIKIRKQMDTEHVKQMENTGKVK